MSQMNTVKFDIDAETRELNNLRKLIIPTATREELESIRKQSRRMMVNESNACNEECIEPNFEESGREEQWRTLSELWDKLDQEVNHAINKRLQANAEFDKFQDNYY